MWDRMVTFARWRREPASEVSSRRALLATSALAGLSLCLLSGGADARQIHKDLCLTALAGKSPAAIEQFLREYPADRLACLPRRRRRLIAEQPAAALAPAIRDRAPATPAAPGTAAMAQATAAPDRAAAMAAPARAAATAAAVRVEATAAAVRVEATAAAVRVEATAAA